MSRSVAARLCLVGLVLVGLPAGPLGPTPGRGDAVAPVPADDFGPVPAFSLTERGGKTVRNDDLRGKVWVASFVFTRCTTGCPQITTTMQRLQGELARYPGVRLVTFTVDP